MSQTSDRYAKALFELAQEGKVLDLVYTSLTQLGGLIDTKDDFRQFLSNPLLDEEERARVIKALFETKLPDLLYKFLLFITFKKRLNIFKEIIQSFDILYVTYTHQLRASVSTATELTQEDKNLINQQLRKKFNLNMLTEWKIDPALIGGFRIFTQGNIYDYSFKSQLNDFFQKAIQPT